MTIEIEIKAKHLAAELQTIQGKIKKARRKLIAPTALSAAAIFLPYIYLIVLLFEANRSSSAIFFICFYGLMFAFGLMFGLRKYLSLLFGINLDEFEQMTARESYLSGKITRTKEEIGLLYKIDAHLKEFADKKIEAVRQQLIQFIEGDFASLNYQSEMFEIRRKVSDYKIEVESKTNQRNTPASKEPNPATIPPPMPAATPASKPSLILPEKPSVILPSTLAATPASKPSVILPKKPSVVPPPMPAATPSLKPSVIPPPKPSATTAGIADSASNSLSKENDNSKDRPALEAAPPEPPTPTRRTIFARRLPSPVTSKQSTGLPLTVQDLFSAKTGQTRQRKLTNWLARKFDFTPNYLQQYLDNQDIGLAGEEFIIEFEKSELLKINRADLASKVAHVSKEHGDGMGYDILSFDRFGKEKLIEVKSTIAKYDAAFFLTANELAKLKSSDNYFIYRVYNFVLEEKTGKLYIINCLDDLFAYFLLEPSVYRVFPNCRTNS